MPKYPITENVEGTLVTTFENKSQIIHHPTYIEFGPSPPFLWEGKSYTFVEWSKELRSTNSVLARRGKTLIIVSSFLTFIGTVFVLARIYVRKRILRHFYIDDWFILVSMIAGLFAFASWTAMAAILIKHYNFTGSKKLFDTSLDVGLAKKMWKAVDVGRPLTATFTAVQANFGRLSILYTFYRFSITGDRRHRQLRVVIHCVAIFMVLAAIPLTWLSIDPCWPPSGGKNSGNMPTVSKCLYIGPIFHVPFQLHGMLFTSVFNAVMDLFCFALPFLIFRGVIISRAKRWSLYALFSFGLCVLLLSILRAVETVKTIKQKWIYDASIPGALRDDEYFAPYVWGFAEAQTVMIGACFPVIAKPFWRTVRPYWYRVWYYPPTIRQGSGEYESTTITGGADETDKSKELLSVSNKDSRK